MTDKKEDNGYTVVEVADESTTLLNNHVISKNLLKTIERLND